MERRSVFSTYPDVKRLVKDVGCGRPIKPGDVQGIHGHCLEVGNLGDR